MRKGALKGVAGGKDAWGFRAKSPKTFENHSSRVGCSKGVRKEYQ